MYWSLNLSFHTFVFHKEHRLVYFMKAFNCLIDYSFSVFAPFPMDSLPKGIYYLGEYFMTVSQSFPTVKKQVLTKENYYFWHWKDWVTVSTLQPCLRLSQVSVWTRIKYFLGYVNLVMLLLRGVVLMIFIKMTSCGGLFSFEIFQDKTFGSIGHICGKGLFLTW